MPDIISEDSVGLVAPETIDFDEPLKLACGRTLSNYQLVVETYGKLNNDKSNAILAATTMLLAIIPRMIKNQAGGTIILVQENRLTQIVFL
jgi:hypothetical protein